MNLSKKKLINIIRKTIKESYINKKILFEGKKRITKPKELTNKFGNKFPSTIRKHKEKYMYIAYRLEDLGSSKADKIGRTKDREQMITRKSAALDAAENKIKTKYKKIIKEENLKVLTKTAADSVIAYIES